MINTLKRHNDIELKNRILELYKDKTIKNAEICRIVGCSKGFVRRVTKEAGIFQPKQINKIWTKEEIDWLIENYPRLHGKKCAQKLNIKISILRHKADSLNLKIEYQDPVDINKFYNIVDKEVAYFLGYFWADGTIRGQEPCVNLTIVQKDAIEIKSLLDSFGNINYYEYKKENKKDISTFKVHSRGLWNFLYKNDYYEKSVKSADKILSKIPENLKHYFYRGFLDGDGCIGISVKNKGHVSFHGSYTQDWTFIEKLLKEMNIYFRIDRTRNQNKLHKRSSVNICGLEKTIKLLNYIYLDRNIDNIGLNRKYDKYLLLKESCKNHIIYKNGIHNNKSYNKSTKLYRVCIEENGKHLPTKFCDNKDEAIQYKKWLIKEYNTREYRLRKLIDYWEFN